MVENIYANAMIAHIPVYGMKEISTQMNAHKKTIACVKGEHHTPAHMNTLVIAQIQMPTIANAKQTTTPVHGYILVIAQIQMPMIANAMMITPVKWLWLNRNILVIAQIQMPKIANAMKIHLNAQ